jgi:molybdopterin converting factor small subunit
VTRIPLVRALLLIGVVALLVVAAGCGGEESGLCQGLEDVQGSVQAIRDTELDEGAVEELQQEADELSANLATAREEAGEELGDEFAAVETSVQTLRTEAEAIAAEDEITREAVAALAGEIGTAANAFEALIAAAPDCDL